MPSFVMIIQYTRKVDKKTKHVSYIKTLCVISYFNYFSNI